MRTAHAAVLIFGLLGAMLAGCSSAPEATCHSNVETSQMPPWGRTGFSDGAVVPHVVGDNGLIVAVPFSQPLVATQEGSDAQNKVLLVAKETPNGPTPLTISARLNGTGDVVHRLRENGPGPGTLDMPLPGCWQMTLQWADQTDTLALEYVADPASAP